jgi:hypothetical protein
MPSINTCNVDFFENFENSNNNNAAGWTVFNSIYSGGPEEGIFTKFLGPFAQLTDTPTRNFAPIAHNNGKVRVEFNFYQLDSWDGNAAASFGPDQFKVEVNDMYMVNLGFFSSVFGTNEMDDGITPAGIKWNHTFIDAAVIAGFNNAASEQRHFVWMDLPTSVLVGNSLKLRFIADLSLDASNESAGIDNLKITSCPADQSFPTVIPT